MLATSLTDGYGVSITFANDAYTMAVLLLDPTSITPPGVDGGEGVDNTTLSNTEVRTKSPRTLKEIVNASFTAAYDPGTYDLIVDAVNVNQLITFTFPDGSTQAVYGFLKAFSPTGLTEGEFPTADCEIVVTNIHDTTGTETSPVTTAASN